MISKCSLLSNDVYIAYCLHCLLLPMCHRSKKWFMTGLPSSVHLLPHSSLIHLAIEAWRSEINDLIIMPVARRYVMASLKAINSMPEMLPAWLA